MAYGDQRPRAPLPLKKKAMFYRGADKPIQLDGFYEGQSIFLICNGPSVNDMNLIPLDARQTFGINNGGVIKPRFWTAQDTATKFKSEIWFDPTILKFVSFPRARACIKGRLVKDCPGIIYHEKSSRCDTSTWLDENCICWGVPKGDGHRLNTMIAALHIIYKLGFKNVYIIGADFTMASDEPYFYDGKSNVSSNNELYKLTDAYLKTLDPLWQKAGYNVYNCTPNGNLTALRRKNYMIALQETEIDLVPIINIVHRNQLPTLLPKGSIAVELGVAAGKYSDKILDCDNIDLLYSIDRWANDRGHNQRQHSNAVELLTRRHGDRSRVIKKTFELACEDFQDNFFDYIYIDGYAHTGQDGGKTLEDWWPKLKPRGIFAGHDYHSKYQKTIETVDAFCVSKNLELHTTSEIQFPSWWVQSNV